MAGTTKTWLESLDNKARKEKRDILLALTANREQRGDRSALMAVAWKVTGRLGYQLSGTAM